MRTKYTIEFYGTMEWDDEAPGRNDVLLGIKNFMRNYMQDVRYAVVESDSIAENVDEARELISDWIGEDAEAFLQDAKIVYPISYTSLQALYMEQEDDDNERRSLYG